MSKKQPQPKKSIIRPDKPVKPPLKQKPGKAPILVRRPPRQPGR
jgi:hypothetical protein